jgi:hypothetical protein
MNEPSESDRLKEVLSHAFEVGTWLVAVILLFVVKPPRLTPADDGQIFVRAAEFVVAILLLLSIVAVRRSRISIRTIWLLALGCLLAAVAGLFGYTMLALNWTCEYDGRGPVVVGSTMLSAAQRYAVSLGNPGCEVLIQDAAGDTASIWPRAELITRHLVLCGIFIATVILFALAAIFAVQTLRRSDVSK